VTLAVLAGAIALAIAWWATARGLSVWATTAPVLAVAGAVALVIAPVRAGGDVSIVAASSVGLGAGVALYVATALFVAAAAPRWRAFGLHAREIYGSRASVPLAVALIVSAGIVAVGEELFWRGLVLRWASDAIGSQTRAAVAGWAAYVLANAPSANLAILVGSAVGGAVWTWLAAWSGGVLASVVCHACWTTLMLARPVVRTEDAA
jgi:membrane protease YdiL (CAAX protease family)